MAASSIRSPKLPTTESNASELSVALNTEHASNSRKTRICTKKPINNSEDVKTSYTNAIATTGTREVDTDQEKGQEHMLTKPPPIIVDVENNEIDVLFDIMVYFKMHNICRSPVVKITGGLCVQMPSKHHHCQFKSYLREKGLSHTACIFPGKLPEHINELRRLKNAARRAYKRYPCEKCRIACRTLERAVKRATASYKCEQWESFLASHPQNDNIGWI